MILGKAACSGSSVAAARRRGTPPPTRAPRQRRAGLFTHQGSDIRRTLSSDGRERRRWTRIASGEPPAGSASARPGCGGGRAARTTTARWWRSGSAGASSRFGNPTARTRPGPGEGYAGARSRGRRRGANSGKSLVWWSARTASRSCGRRLWTGITGATACASSSCARGPSRSCGSTFGVMDHHVDLGGGAEVHVPMRVLPNGARGEALAALSRQPGTMDARFAADASRAARGLPAPRVLPMRRRAARPRSPARSPATGAEAGTPRRAAGNRPGRGTGPGPAARRRRGWRRRASRRPRRSPPPAAKAPRRR